VKASLGTRYNLSKIKISEYGLRVFTRVRVRVRVAGLRYFERPATRARVADLRISKDPDPHAGRGSAKSKDPRKDPRALVWRCRAGGNFNDDKYRSVSWKVGRQNDYSDSSSESEEDEGDSQGSVDFADSDEPLEFRGY
jgi:hypothetical protein